MDSSFFSLETAQEIGLSSVFGFCSGYTLKKVGKLVALAIGVGFVAERQGWIPKPNWGKVNKVLVEHADFNGDGKVDVEDLNTCLDGAKDYLGIKITSVAGFGGGFFVGFYLG